MEPRFYFYRYRTSKGTDAAVFFVDAETGGITGRVDIFTAYGEKKIGAAAVMLRALECEGCDGSDLLQVKVKHIIGRS